MQPFFNQPPKITISITNSCNLSCRHCYGNCTATPTAAELSCDEWIAFVDYLVENEFIQLYIEGGEPLCKPGFDRLLAHCGRKLMTMVRTNGTLLGNETASSWKRYGVGHVFVDILGTTAGTHDALTGAPGSFAKACRAVRHLVEVGIPTDILFILNRRNVHELPEYGALAARLGASRIGVLRLYPLGRAKHRWSELALSLEEQTAALASVRLPDGVGLMQSWHPNNANCCWQASAVNAFGDSIGCTYLREYVNFGNIRERPFLDTWRKDPLYRTLRSGQVEHSCPSCHGHEGTFGGCRSTAYAFHGRWSAPDPFCSHLNKGVNLRVLPEWVLHENPQPPDQSDPRDEDVRGVYAG